MVCLALVLELHHPLPGPGDGAGAGWAAAAIDCDWPVLRAVSRFAEKRTGAALTLAISPSWMALASDASARALLLGELDGRRLETPGELALRRFVVDGWEGDAVALVRELSESGAVEVIPTTSSHTWLPSVADDPVVARAQVGLAAADHARRLGTRGSGIWLPFLGYRPGLESAMGAAGLRYFAVGGEVFVRGSILPPAQVFAPMVTPPGVAAFAVSAVPARQVSDPEAGYGRDPRYLDPMRAGEAAADHARHFLSGWLAFASSAPAGLEIPARPVSVVHLAAHELGRFWPAGRGGDWLLQVLDRLSDLPGAIAVSLGGYLDRDPSGVLGRPGPSAGGILSARPGGSDLFDRCRAAADLLTFALERRRGFGLLEHRCVAHMTRSLLRAQQVDWSLPPGHGADPRTGLQRALAHLDRFYGVAGGLMSGRPDRRLLDELDRGPCYLPEIDLEVLAGN